MARKQKRGCSRLVYASYAYDKETDTITFGAVKPVAPVKAISRTIDEASEEVWADNELQEETYGGKRITRSFDCTPLEDDVIADLFGQSAITISGTDKAYAENPTGERSFYAFGYALHDGDIDNPCEIVWAYKGKASTLSDVSNTIKQGDTASEGQTLEITFYPVDKKFTATGKRNLDISVRVKSGVTWDWEDFFTQVVTPDNITTILV